MRIVTTTFLLLLLAGKLTAQSGSVAALRSFQDTQFFTDFREMRDRSESAVRNFKLIQNRFTEEQVANVAAAYNSSAEYFNAALLNIKADLMHKDKRKYLISYPESYSKQIEADLYRAKEFYSNTFQKEITEVTNGQITGIALIALIPQIIKYAQLAIQVYKEIDSQIKKMNAAILDQYLVQPNRFKSWDEIK